MRLLLLSNCCVSKDAFEDAPLDPAILVDEFDASSFEGWIIRQSSRVRGSCVPPQTDDTVTMPARLSPPGWLWPPVQLGHLLTMLIARGRDH